MVLLTACIVIAADAGFPIPPERTPTQIATYARLSKAANTDSPAATAQVLAALKTPAFRANLNACCPDLASLSPVNLLKRYRSTIEVAEIAHCFHAKYNATQLNALDVGMDVMQNATWFYNQWQMPVLFPRREMQAYYQTISFLAPAAVTENGLWNFPAFTAPNPLGNVWEGGWPKDLGEASDRVIYTILNQHKVDFPGFNWGDTAVVFNNSAIRESVIFSPVDSGDITCHCNTTFTNKFCGQWTNRSSCSEFWYCNWVNKTSVCIGEDASMKHNCSSGVESATGTFESFDHLIMPYADWYFENKAAERLAHLFARALRLWDLSSKTQHEQEQIVYPNMTTPFFDYYWEANIASNPTFPHSVKFIIATLPYLFGTVAGQQVRDWCKKWGWVLVWSLGSNPEISGGTVHPPTSWAGTARILDPTALLQTTASRNMTSTSYDLPAQAKLFEAQWATATQRRANDSHLNPEDFSAWWADLSDALAPALRVQPLFPGSCSAVELCVGVNTLGDCICYAH